jgi:hypothetical protein
MTSIRNIKSILIKIYNYSIIKKYEMDGPYNTYEKIRNA